MRNEQLVFDGGRYTPDSAAARMMAQKAAQDQLVEAGKLYAEASADEQDALERNDSEALLRAQARKAHAQNYRKFALTRQRSGAITASLTEAAPRVRVKVDELDADPLLLNHQSGTTNLLTGKTHPHYTGDLQTKIAAVAPSYVNMYVWKEHLQAITCGNSELSNYLQCVAGMIVIGRVFEEKIVIAYGGGRNGKSTFFNTLAMVLGDYAGMISSDALTMNTRRNTQYELAELRGKRMGLAPELEEGAHLNSAFVKKVASTDEIFAERKYADPFTFKPSHTIIMPTNHLPHVRTNDDGIWRRLLIIPFKAVFSGNGEKKNYGQYLFEECGGAVLQWMIEGAKKFADAGFKLPEPPACVREELEDYKQASDWLNDFIEEVCDLGDYQEEGGRLYEAYRIRCIRTGEYPRKNADFKTALLRRGFEYKKTMHGARYRGLKLKSVFGVYPPEAGADLGET